MCRPIGSTSNAPTTHATLRQPPNRLALKTLWQASRHRMPDRKSPTYLHAPHQGHVQVDQQHTRRVLFPQQPRQLRRLGPRQNTSNTLYQVRSSLAMAHILRTSMPPMSGMCRSISSTSDARTTHAARKPRQLNPANLARRTLRYTTKNDTASPPGPP
jgi:hypothetical protein